MKISPRALLFTGLAVVVALLIAVGVIWFRQNFHQVEQSLPLPPKGEASYNPLYLLKKSLQADGVTVNARQRLALENHPLAPHDTLLLFNDPRVLSVDQQDALLEWVDAGGHLIVRTPLLGEDDEITIGLFEEIGVFLTNESECATLNVDALNPIKEFCGRRRFKLHEVEPELSWGDLKAGYVFARLAHGDGHVDVLAGLDALENGDVEQNDDDKLIPTDGLREVQHQAFARQLLAPNYKRGTVHLIYAAEMPSLLRLLLTSYWMVWLPLLLALLGWLWSRMRRFGSELPAPEMARRSLLEHVRASGDHIYRHGRGVLLYLAVRQAFFARLRRRDPVAAALTGDAQAELIAKRFGLTTAAVRNALQTPSSHERAHFRERISLLIELRNRL
ncbi:MAG TPA: DUF4350 domain-containing protein [Pseudoxanthomonas sp.]|nr:DUF4350 domain-containing protein [Pseudoxanthomonas sp.]